MATVDPKEVDPPYGAVVLPELVGKPVDGKASTPEKAVENLRRAPDDLAVWSSKNAPGWHP